MKSYIRLKFSLNNKNERENQPKTESANKTSTLPEREIGLTFKTAWDHRTVPQTSALRPSTEISADQSSTSVSVVSLTFQKMRRLKAGLMQSLVISPIVGS